MPCFGWARQKCGYSDQSLFVFEIFTPGWSQKPKKVNWTINRNSSHWCQNKTYFCFRKFLHGGKVFEIYSLGVYLVHHSSISCFVLGELSTEPRNAYFLNSASFCCVKIGIFTHFTHSKLTLRFAGIQFCDDFTIYTVYCSICHFCWFVRLG